VLSAALVIDETRQSKKDRSFSLSAFLGEKYDCRCPQPIIISRDDCVDSNAVPLTEGDLYLSAACNGYSHVMGSFHAASQRL